MPWRDGSRIGDAPGTGPVCGTAEQWFQGQPLPPVRPVPVDAFGTPVCCLPPPRLLIWADPVQIADIPPGDVVDPWPSGPGAVEFLQAGVGWAPGRASPPGVVFSVLPQFVPNGIRFTLYFPNVTGGTDLAWTLVVVGRVLTANGEPYFSVGNGAMGGNENFALYHDEVRVSAGFPQPTFTVRSLTDFVDHVWVVTSSATGVTVRVDGILLGTFASPLSPTPWASNVGLTVATVNVPLGQGYDVFHLRELQWWNGVLPGLDINALEHLLLNRIDAQVVVQRLGTEDNDSLMSEDNDYIISTP